MNLNCPYCGETIQYDRSLSGKSVQCSYCNQVLKMPTFEELPEELREALAEQEARKQERDKRKYLRKQEQFLREMDKEEHRKRKEEEDRRQKEFEAKIASVEKPVLEEMAVKERYPALRIIAFLYKAGAVANLVLYVGFLILILIGSGYVGGPLSWRILGVLIAAIALAVPTLFITLVQWAIAEFLLTFVDIADDVRTTRLLIKRQVYQSKES